MAGPRAASAERPPPTVHHARVVWEGREDLRAHRVELAGETVRCSSAPELGGVAERADPEELFVAALSSCHMLWFLDLARRRRLRVRAYEDEAVGEMDGVRFTRVTLRPRVELDPDPGAEALDELHHGAHELCFISSSVNCPVQVERR